MATSDRDLSQELIARVREAAQRRAPLNIVGGGSKAFYGRSAQGETINVAEHRGIVRYEPTELVITARAGTPLAEIERTLYAHGQMLPSESPRLADTATLGGTVATNLSGPRRPYAGAVRDLVLGVTIINGEGEKLRFGGEVMKNVAGYDVSRLQCGALGTLGILLDVSLKVLPRPESEMTLRRDCDAHTAVAMMSEWANRPCPLSGAIFDGAGLYLRFSGSARAVSSAAKMFGGERVRDDSVFWNKVRESEHPFFAGDATLWRLSVPPGTPVIGLPGPQFYDWGGALRWFRGTIDDELMFLIAAELGGHAMKYRGGDRNRVFAPLDSALLALHRRVKQAMDPHGIFNPGRLYAEI